MKPLAMGWSLPSFNGKRIAQIVLGILFLVIIFEIIIISPEQMGKGEPDHPSTANNQTETKDQFMRGVHLIEARDGKPEWELWSHEAQGGKQQEIWNLTDVNLQFFGDDSQNFNVTGQRGRFVVASRQVSVEGNVKTLSSNGYTYWADNLGYDSQKRVLQSSGPVQLLGPKAKSEQGLTLKGEGMATDLSTSKMSVLANVQAQQTFHTGQIANIKSSSAEFSGKSRQALFRGSVIIDTGTVRITGPEAEFIYGANGDQLESLVVRQGAKVSDIEKWATADQVTYLVNENKYLFNGNPMVIQDNDELRGDQIIFLNGGKEVKVLGVKARIENRDMERFVEPTEN